MKQEIQTRIVQKWHLPALGHVIALQKKVWSGWKTISWCYSDILLNYYGPNPKDWEYWLWWNYFGGIEEESAISRVEEILKNKST